MLSYLGLLYIIPTELGSIIPYIQQITRILVAAQVASPRYASEHKTKGTAHRYITG